jgi:lysophospholipase L1-like esterase
MSETGKRILLVVASTIVFLLLCIVGYEIYGNIRYRQWRSEFDGSGKFQRLTIPSPDKILMWEYKPYGEYGKIKTNRFGFREYDGISTEAAADSYRIAFIGDSITLGMEVDLEDTFVKILEREAPKTRSGKSIQTLNFGIDGYSAIQIHELLSCKVMNFSPNAVVYVMCLNDFDFVESSGGKTRYFAKPKSFLLERIEKLRQRLSNIDFHLYHFYRNRQSVYQLIVQMNELLKSNNSVLTLVIIPVFKLTESGFADYPLGEMHNDIAKFALEEGIDVIDLLKSFANQTEPPAYFAADIWHLNENGHRFVAQQLLAKMKFDGEAR